MDHIVSTEYDGKSRSLYKKSCKECEKDFWIPLCQYDKRLYCSSNCSSISRRARLEIECVWCHSKCWKTQSKLRNSRSGLYFCTRKCKDEAQRLGGIEAIQPDHYGSLQRSYRLRAFREYGKKCKQCGYSKDSRMLDVDHIDSNRSNNAIENLQVLCVWHHARKTRANWPKENV